MYRVLVRLDVGGRRMNERCIACGVNRVEDNRSGWCSDCTRFSPAVSWVGNLVERADTLDDLKQIIITEILPRLDYSND